MGNQGMTNWKFSAFFAISLMLIAGLFSNAAIADGEGRITIAWGEDGGSDSYPNTTLSTAEGRHRSS